MCKNYINSTCTNYFMWFANKYIATIILTLRNYVATCSQQTIIVAFMLS